MLPLRPRLHYIKHTVHWLYCSCCWFHLGSAYLHIIYVAAIWRAARRFWSSLHLCTALLRHSHAKCNRQCSAANNWTIEFRTVRGTVSTEHAELTCLGDHFLADHLTWTRSHCAEINSKWDIRRAPILLEVYLYFWCCISAPWCSKFNTFVAFPKCRQNLVCSTSLMASLIRSVGGLSKCFYQGLWLALLSADVIGQSINRRGDA